MWYDAKNNAIGGEKQNNKNKAKNIRLGGVLFFLISFLGVEIFFRLMYAIVNCTFFSRPFMKFSDFSKSVDTIFIILHSHSTPKGAPVCGV